MNKITISENKTLKYHIVVYTLIFTVGFFGGFSFLEKSFSSLLDSIRISEWINAKQILYLMLFAYAVIIFFPILLKDIKALNKNVLNEISTVLFVVVILSALIKLLFGGISINSNLSETVNGYIAFDGIIKVILIFPIIEELYCRYSITYLIKKYIYDNNYLCILISAIIFSVFHYKNLIGKDLNIICYYILVYLILGVGCSYLYLYTNNIMSSIILHMIWNASMVAGAFLFH